MKKQYWLAGAAMAAAFCLSGCIGDGDAAMETPVGFATVAEGANSGIRSQRFEVIRDQEAWTSLWATHTQTVSPAPAPPPVDFNNDMVIAAYLGEKPTGGFDLEFLGITQNPDGLRATIEAKAPGPNCLVTQALTQPHHVVRLPRSAKSVSFEIVFARTDCPR